MSDFGNEYFENRYFEEDSDTVQSEKLQELALFFFKKGGVTAEESYEHALSFMNISKNSKGKDIVEVTVRYYAVIENIMESLSKKVKYLAVYSTENMEVINDSKKALLCIVSERLTPEIVGREFDKFIFNTLLPKNLTQNNDIVIKLKLVQDLEVKDLCKGAKVFEVML